MRKMWCCLNSEITAHIFRQSPLEDSRSVALTLARERNSNLGFSKLINHIVNVLGGRGLRNYSTISSEWFYSSSKWYKHSKLRFYSLTVRNDHSSGNWYHFTMQIRVEIRDFKNKFSAFVAEIPWFLYRRTPEIAAIWKFKDWVCLKFQIIARKWENKAKFHISWSLLYLKAAEMCLLVQ